MIPIIPLVLMLGMIRGDTSSQVENCRYLETNALGNRRCKTCDEGYRLSIEPYPAMEQPVSRVDIGRLCVVERSYSSITNCLSLDSELDGCNKCKSGYLISLEGDCLECLEECVQCDSEQIGCRCKEGSSTDYATPCINCLILADPYCTACSPNSHITCIKCKEGYTLNETSGICEEIMCNISECDLCFSANVCSKCVKERYLLEEANACIKYCPNSIEYTVIQEGNICTCSPNYFMQSTSEGYFCMQDCVQDAACVQCQRNGICNLCKDDFKIKLEMKQCVSCNANCTCNGMLENCDEKDNASQNYSTIPIYILFLFLMLIY